MGVRTVYCKCVFIYAHVCVCQYICMKENSNNHDKILMLVLETLVANSCTTTPSHSQWYDMVAIIIIVGPNDIDCFTFELSDTT